MQRLRGFVHVSTAYVNSNLPRGSHIEERVYSLRLRDGQVLDHVKLAAQLSSLAPGPAEKLVRMHCIPTKCASLSTS
jgi:fatty acyl-CoA reductase